MRVKFRKVVVIALMLIIAVLALPFADAARADTVVEPGKLGSIKISYVNAAGKAIRGATFTARLVGEPVWNGTFRSLVKIPLNADTDPRDVVALAADIEPVRVETSDYGVAVMTEMPQGLYLIQEEVPADGYFASVPFFATIPFMQDGEWAYDLEADPKPLAAGNLRISKEVRGSLADTKRLFKFRIHFEDVGDGEFPIAYSTGTTGMIANDAIIELRHGEYATVSMLQPGTVYAVEELGAEEDGYAVTATGDKGEVTAKDAAEAAFVNTKGEVPPPECPTPTPVCATCTPVCATCTPVCATCTPVCATCTPIGEPTPCVTCPPGRTPPTQPPIPPNVQTGDSPAMPIAFAMGLALAVVGGLAILFGRRRKN